MTALDQNFSDLASILMQRRQQQNQQSQQDRANRLSDLQFTALQDEQNYKTGLRGAMANPQTTRQTSIAPQQAQAPQLSLASLGNQMQPQQFQPTPQAPASPSAQAYNEGRVSTQTTTQTPGQAGAAYAMSQGRVDDAVKMFSLDDAAAQLQARGNLQDYYTAKKELEDGAKFFEVLKPYKGNPAGLQQVWPQIQRMFPDQSEGIDPTKIGADAKGMFAPLIVEGKEIPNRVVYHDDDGKTHIVDTTPKVDQEALMDKRFANQQTLQSQQIAAQDRRTAAQIDAADRRGNKKDVAKPLPVSALKMQQEATDAIGTASGIRADLGVIRQQVESGALKLGPVRNLAGAAANATGMSTENSRNLATFKTTLEKLRNDSLRLNKGVQTDGDAQRAWNELMTNINDPGVVKQRLAEIDRINERAVDLHRASIDNVRNNYGQDPLDTSAQTNVQPALGKRQAPQGKPAPKLSKKAQSIADRY